MKAFQLQEKIGVEALTLIEYEDSAIGVDQVRIQFKACSLNYRDQSILEGGYMRNDTRPIIPLSDGAGVVVEAGSAVNELKVGDRVSPIFLPEWISGEIRESYLDTCLGGGVDGVLRESAVFPEQALVKIPDQLSYSEASTLPCAALTAWNALFELGDVSALDTVLILGTGGVSVFALQFCKAIGARVVMTSSSDEKLAKCQKLGADITINYKKYPDWHREVLRLNNEKGVDYVLEVGGPGTLERSMKALRVGGRIQLIGVLDSPKAKISPMLAVFNSLNIQGVYVGSKEMFSRMNSFIIEHNISPVVDSEYPFLEIKEAFEYFIKQKHFGKIAIHI